MWYIIFSHTSLPSNIPIEVFSIEVGDVGLLFGRLLGRLLGLLPPLLPN